MNSIYTYIYLGIIFGIFVSFGTLFRIILNRKVDLVDWFTLAFGFFNGFSFAFILWSTNNGKNDWIWSQWLLGKSSYYPAFLASSLLFVMSVWFVASIKDFKVFIKKYDNFKPRTLVKSNNSRIAVISWIMLIAAIFSYYVYASGYGGFTNLLKFAPLIRSGRFDLIEIDNPWTFLSRVGSFAFFSSFVFFGLFLHKLKHKGAKTLDFVGFLISFAVSFFILYSWLGRIALVSYLLVFPIGYLIFKYGFSFRFFLWLSIIVVMVVFVAIPYMNVFLKRGTPVQDIQEFYTKEMSFPYVSFIAQLKNSTYRNMKDILMIPLYILPDSIFKDSLNLDTSSDVNTMRIKGALKGQDNVSGEIPADILTFSFMQGGIFGLFAVGILLGICLLFLDSFISKLPAGISEVLYAYAIINCAVLLIPYGDPRHFVLENIYFIFGMLALYVFKGVHVEKKS